jgi:ParB-like partition proteins
MERATVDKQRPRLKKLDDLFLLNGDSAEVQYAHTSTNRFHDVVTLESLVPFEKHPFRLYEGERLDDMVESIRKNGVLVPIIAREKNGKYEILSGHNRANASQLAGLSDIPAILLKEVSDKEAWIYVIETNLMQRSFSDMSHSEKAAVIAMQNDEMFSQGKRNDIIKALKMIEKPNGINDNGTSSQVGTKLRTDEKIGEAYSLSRNTIARYLRINHLIPAMKTLLDSDKIYFIPAVTISFLKDVEQRNLAKCIDLNGFKVDTKKAEILRQYSENGKLDDERIYLVLNGELGQKPKPNRTPVVKVNKAVYAKYFQPTQSAKEVQDTVEKALAFYHEHGKSEPSQNILASDQFDEFFPKSYTPEKREETILKLLGQWQRKRQLETAR